MGVTTNTKNLKIATQNLQCLVVGETGTGKSCFAASFPEPIRLIAPDKGLLTYRGKDVEATTYDLVMTEWIPLVKDINEFLKIQKETRKFKTLIIDSTSSLSDIAMAYVIALTGVDKPSWAEFGQVKDLVWNLTKNILTANCHVVIISHIQYKTNDLTGKTVATPLLAGQLAIKYPQLFDEVYYADPVDGAGGKTDYRILTSPTGLLRARSRLSGITGLLPKYIPNNFNELFKHIKEIKE